ncbi:MAG: carbohydrate ABC transporter permease [Acidimicrobiales bacterium]
MMKVSRRSRRLADNPWFFLGPGLVFLIVINIFPLVYSLWVSLHVDELANPSINHFTGFENYIHDLRDSEFLYSLLTSLILTAATVAIQFAVGFAIGLALYRRDVRWRRLFTSILILPLAVSPLVVSILWRFMLDPANGILPYLFGRVGINLGSPLTSTLGAYIVLVVVYSWEWTPFVALFLYSAMMGLDTGPFEAATVDGATPVQTVRHVMVPMLRQLITILGLLEGVTAFRMFTVVDIVTSGGPGTSTQSASYLVWQNALNFFNMGTATSMSWIIIVIMSIAVLIMIKVWRFEV